MQEKKILPRRKGVVLLSVLGCLFVFFVKTEKDLAANGNVLWTAGYVGSTLAWSVILGSVLGMVGDPGGLPYSREYCCKAEVSDAEPG